MPTSPCGLQDLLAHLWWSHGVWESTVREVISAQATSGGTFVFRNILNSHEGPIRIHETIAFVVGQDGTVKVDRYTFDVVGWP
jgi:hypothetical protein